MPGGSKWLSHRPDLIHMPTKELWRIHNRAYSASGANPRSQARMALPGTHAMLYAADSLPGALWETLLRYSLIKPGRVAEFDLSRLDGQLASRIRMKRTDVPLLELSRPGLLSLFPDGDGAAAGAVSALLATPDHKSTHPDARALYQELKAMGVPEMPVLSWPSRQFAKSEVFVAYEPPMDETWWEEIGDPIELDNPRTGHPLIAEELAKSGFTWRPIGIGAEDPDDESE